MNSKFTPVGETFQSKDGVTLKVVECYSCTGCHFWNSIIKECVENEDISEVCDKTFRLDQLSVIFVKI